MEALRALDAEMERDAWASWHRDWQMYAAGMRWEGTEDGKPPQPDFLQEP